MSRGYAIRRMEPGDRDAIAAVIYHSLNAYYVSIGRGEVMTGGEETAAIFFDVYEKIDPGEGIIAVDDESGAIIGSCFVHPRETHFSLGIMTVHPEQFGRGVARALLSEITERAAGEGKSVRLVSSCFNLESYSLYTRAGFVPFATFQDMMVAVPEDGLGGEAPEGMDSVRAATLEDVEAMAAVEMEVSGISRRNDYRYFIENSAGYWSVSVYESAGGEGVDGFLVSCGSPDFNMVGPGVARTEGQAAAMAYAELDGQRGKSPILLAPVGCGELVKCLYEWGGRNCEMHVAQSLGPVADVKGVVMPTFLPESG
ncbi:MAG: GNAT family N-acetyltransferase [Verrucomicrobiota bacterium]